MDNVKKDYSINSYKNNEVLKLFFEKFLDKRNEIFEYIHKVLENGENEEEKKCIQDTIKQEGINNDNKIQIIKKIKNDKYLKNFKENYKSGMLEKYNLGLIRRSFLNVISLVFYGDIEDLKNFQVKQADIDNKKNDGNNHGKNLDKLLVLLDIKFLVKIKINDDEEWICNSDYALYLIYIMKNLKNPYPFSEDERSEDSKYYLDIPENLEHFVFITNNKIDRKKKSINEIKAELDISNIYDEIQKKDTMNNINEYVKYSLKNINIEDDDLRNYENNEIFSYFETLDYYRTLKNVIFQDENVVNSFYKIILLNNLYYGGKIRFFYLDLNILNNLKSSNDKKKYLSYYIARLYNCNTEFKDDFEAFAQ